jgi:hypothetical protein
MNLPRDPSPHELFNAARTKIFLEHGQLRSRLGEALAIVDGAARGDSAALAELPRVVICSLADLKSHFAFEESVLVPLLAASGSVGKSDAVELVRGHADQRERLGALVDDVDRSRASPALAADLRRLVDDVFTDMADEEAKLIRSEVVAAGEASDPHLVELRRWL